MMRTLVIYEETGSDKIGPMVEFPVGRFISRKKMDEMFAKAAKMLKVNEARLVYDIFD